MADERAELLAFLNVFAASVMPRFEGVEFKIPIDTPLGGLREGVGDMLEMTAPMSPDEIAAIETLLAAAGAPSLAAIRLRYSRRLNAIIKRGEIRNEAEYRIVRSFAEGLDHLGEGRVLWSLIADFERP